MTINWTRSAVMLLAASSIAAVSAACEASEEQVQVPDVVGLRLADANAALDAAGLEVQREAVDDEVLAKPAHRVLEQDPAAGTTVDAGSSVVISYQP